jgi:AcrR family transcriptional regulator
VDYQQRRQLQAQDTRRAILAAAAQLSRQGRFDKMTVRDVCAAAGVTTGAFYHHFSSKEDLLKQGFTSVDVFLEKALEPYRDLPPLDRLEALARLYARFMEEQGWETISLYYSRRLLSPEADPMDPDRYTLRAMRECLTALAQDGILSPALSPEWTADFFFRHFRGTVIDWVLHQGSYPLWPKLEQDYDLFARSFQA